MRPALSIVTFRHRVWCTIPTTAWYPLLNGSRLQIRQISDFAGTVADFVHRNAHAVQHRHKEVRHRSFGGVLYMPPRCQSRAAAAGQHRRKILVQVLVAIAKPAAIDDHGMIEQSSVAVLRGLQLPKEVGELLDVEA